ncbi:MAG: lytic transglycosylase domain-containing protein [Gemmatimonadaceae bacterium]
MKDLSHTYTHYGDRLRRRRRFRAWTIVLGFWAVVTIAAKDWQPERAIASQLGALVALPLYEISSRVSGSAAPAALPSGAGRTEAGDWFAGENVARWNKIFRYAKRYGIAPDLAAAIHDEALAAKLDPELAFRVVRLESRFVERARSPVGAVGLTQLMPATARFYEPGVTRDSLYERHTNLRIGFRYLRDLIRQYRSVKVALLVYNRGPGAVLAAQEQGLDPSNGYDTIVLRGYRGRGVVR